jgi:membrane fusion protein (multidrug efflux system)
LFSPTHKIYTMKQIFVIIIVAAILCGCRNQNQGFNLDVAVDVKVESVSPGSIQNMVSATGNLMASRSVTLTNEMSGAYYLQNNPATGTPYKMGDVVNKGNTIIRLKDKAYENTTDIEGNRLSLEISEQEYKKLQALFEKGGATRRELVNAEKQLSTAKKNYENAKINLAKMGLQTPFNGVITSIPHYSQEVRVEQGKEMAVIMNFDHLVMDITLPSAVFGEVSRGQKCLIANYGKSENTIPGELSQLSPALDEQTRSFEGRITIKNEDKVLRPGMFVNASIIVEEKDSVLTVPTEVVLSQRGSDFVFVADNETARKRIVQTGLEGKERIEITGGLTKDEKIVVKGFETLRDGSKIKLQ